VSGASPGGAAGAILAGPAADRFGRKTLLIADAGIYATGVIIPAATPDAAVRLFARTLIGLAVSVFPGSAASTGWRMVLCLGAIPALIGLGLRTQMPQ